LRKIYYKEWVVKAEKGSFSPDLGALGLKEKDLKVDDFVFPPVIQTATSLFEAIYRAKSGEAWHISQDGKVWKDK
jgi:hypothetical protein